LLKPSYDIFRVTNLRDADDEPKLEKLAIAHVQLFFSACGGCLLLTTIVFVIELRRKNQADNFL